MQIFQVGGLKSLGLRFKAGWGDSLLLLRNLSCHHGREPGHLLEQEGGRGAGDGLDGLALATRPVVSFWNGMGLMHGYYELN